MVFIFFPIKGGGGKESYGKGSHYPDLKKVSKGGECLHTCYIFKKVNNGAGL